MLPVKRRLPNPTPKMRLVSRSRGLGPFDTDVNGQRPQHARRDTAGQDHRRQVTGHHAAGGHMSTFEPTSGLGVRSPLVRPERVVIPDTRQSAPRRIRSAPVTSGRPL